MRGEAMEGATSTLWDAVRRLAAAALALALAASGAVAQAPPPVPPAPTLGAHWTPVVKRDDMCGVTPVQFAPGARQALTAAMGSGLCHSLDGGRTWQRWWGGEFDGTVMFLRDGSLLGQHADGVWLSRDFGLTMEVRHIPGTGMALLGNVLAMHGDGERGIALGTAGQVHLTQDRWRSLRTIAGLTGQRGLGGAIGPDGKTVVAVFAEYWMLTGTIAVSRDFGVTWTIADLPRNLASPSEAKFAFAADGGILLQVRETLLYSADHGASWWPLRVPGIQPIPDYAFSPDLATVLVRDEAGLLLLRPAAGPEWSATRVLPLKDWTGTAFGDGGRVVAVVGGEGELFLSRDFGRNWARVPAPGSVQFVALSAEAETLAITVETPQGRTAAYISTGR